MTSPAGAPIIWSADFLLLEGDMPCASALRLVREATEYWIVIRRYDGMYLYAFTVGELLASPALADARERGVDLTSVSLETALDLHEELQSTKAPARSTPPPIDKTWRPESQGPSVDRYVEAGDDNIPRAVGIFAVEGTAKRSTRTARARPPLPAAAPPPQSPAAAPAPPRPAESVRATPPLEDEGTTPIRFPSIEPNAEIVPGGPVSLTVDLKRRPDERTEGGAVAPGSLAADWTELDLEVALSSSAIDFDNEGRGTVTMRRNADSISATMTGRVKPNVAAGSSVAVIAAFYYGTRFCGSARRMLVVGTVASPALPALSEGEVSPEPFAEQPDLTVHISALDSTRPGFLLWQLMTPRFDGLPPRLDATIDLGNAPSQQAAELFKRFATLERGKHRARIDGFGSELWLLAPQMFRDAYWALWDKYRRPLRIQFISDDPHLPWELMRPARHDDSEIHPPLALKHPVARWIKRWDGYMRNSIPQGRIFTIAPKYSTVSRTLPRAQAEAQLLVKEFNATPVQGTRQAVDALLQARAPSENVAILHFAGHGTFSADVASDASIKLEDGELTASEVARPEVRLGKNSRTIVFFNACEVGATGAVFGQVGGWADALLGRQFGGFIAPLWSVDDEDASVVATELLEGVLGQHKPVGDVMRDLRVKHGDTSPTFYSYLFYGDVTAHVGT